jgi:hypothetical protein
MTVLFIIAAVVSGLQMIGHTANIFIALDSDDDELGRRSCVALVWSIFFLVMFILAAIHV